MKIHKLPTKKASLESFSFFEKIFRHYWDVEKKELEQTIVRLSLGRADGFFVFEEGLLGVGEFELHPWGIGYWIHFLFKDPDSDKKINKNVFSDLVTFIENYAKVRGAEATYFYGRSAWGRLLNGYGVSSFYSKELRG